MGWAMQGKCALGRGITFTYRTTTQRVCQSDFSHRAPSGAQSIMASALQSALAVGLEVVLQSIGTRTLDDLASGIRDRGDEIADYITSSSCRRAALVAAQERERAAQAATAASSAATAALQAATLAASAAEMEARLFRIELLAAEGMAAAHVERAADHSAHVAALLADVERLEALNSDVDLIDVWIAEAVVAEALLIGEQQAARETAARWLAEERACKLERERCWKCCCWLACVSMPKVVATVRDGALEIAL